MFKLLRLKKANQAQTPSPSCMLSYSPPRSLHTLLSLPIPDFSILHNDGFYVTFAECQRWDQRHYVILHTKAAGLRRLAWALSFQIWFANGHTLCSIDETYVCLFYIIIMHLNIETLLNAFRSALSGPSKWKSDSVMIQNISICLLMQFKMSVVKYSERDYTFKPLGAPFGGMVGLCSPLAVAAMAAALCPSRGSLSPAQGRHSSLFSSFPPFLFSNRAIRCAHATCGE